MKKVLIMLSSLNIGGVEKSLLSLLSILPKEQFDITLLLLEKKGGFLPLIPEWIRVEQVGWYQQIKPVITQPPYSTLTDLIQKRNFSNIPRFVFSYAVAEKVTGDRSMIYRYAFRDVSNNEKAYDIAVSYQGPTEIIDYYIANKVNAVKKVSLVHFDVSKHVMNEKFYYHQYKYFDKIFAVSYEALRQLVKKIPAITEKVDVCMNRISEKLIHEMAEEEVDFDENYKGVKIVTVGRLSKEKGQDIAINVLSKLRNAGYEVRWYCVGDGKQRNEYEQQIENHNLNGEFILMGSTPNPYPFIASADIYVQPSRHEGFCLSLAEARCLAKPIVTTDFIGANEQLEDGVNGLIAECTANGLFLKIKYLLDNPDEMFRLKNNLRKSVLNSNQGDNFLERCAVHT